MLNVDEIIEYAKSKTINYYNNTYYSKILKIVKEYSKNNNIIIEYNENNKFIIKLYSTHPFKDSNNITNLLYKDGDFKYTVLSTHIMNKELSISINNQRIIYIKLLFIPNIIIYQKINNIQSIINIWLECLDNCNINYILDNEKITYPNLIKFLDNYNKIKIKNNKIINKNTIKYLINENIFKFILKKEIILLDYYALNSDNYDFNKTIQIIINNNMSIEIINKLNEILKKNNINGIVDIQTDYTYFIDDFRLEKKLIYIKIYENNKPITKINILNYFNEITYNIIPVLKNNNLIPSVYILLKYLILNIISIKIHINNPFLYYENIKFIKIALSKINEKNEYTYIGQYKNKELDLDIIPVYRPAQYELKNNNLRSF